MPPHADVESHVARILNAPPNAPHVVFDLPRGSGVDAFRSRYKELARTLHPDKARCDAAEDAFKIVTEAFRQVTQGGVDRNAGVADAGGFRSGRKPFWSVDASATASAAPAAPKWSAAPEDASTRSRWGGGGVSGAPTASKTSKTHPRASTRWDRWDHGFDVVVEEEEEEEIDEHAKAAQEEDAAWFSTWGASIYGDDERTGPGPKPARWSEGGGFGFGGGGGGGGGGGSGGSRGQRSSGGSFDKWSAPELEPANRRRATRVRGGIGIGSRRKFPREDHWRNNRSESDDDEDDGDLDEAFVVADGAPHADGDLEDEPRVGWADDDGVATARDWITGGDTAGGGRYWSDPPATGGGRGGGWGRVAGATVSVAGATVRGVDRVTAASPHVAIVDEEDDGEDGGEDVERRIAGAGPGGDEGRAAEGKGKGKTRSYPWRRRRRKGKGKVVTAGDGQENAGANRDPSTAAAAARKRPRITLDEPRIPHTRLPKKAFTQATLAFS